jgi:hypothetical protein
MCIAKAEAAPDLHYPMLGLRAGNFAYSALPQTDFSMEKEYHVLPLQAAISTDSKLPPAWARKT